MILLGTWWSKEGGAVKLSGADIRLLGLLGLGVLGNHLLILMGLNYVSGAVGGVIIGSSPVVTALLSAMLTRDVPLGSHVGGEGCCRLRASVCVGIQWQSFKRPERRPLLGSLLVFRVVGWAPMVLAAGLSWSGFQH